MEKPLSIDLANPGLVALITNVEVVIAVLPMGVPDNTAEDPFDVNITPVGKDPAITENFTSSAMSVINAAEIKVPGVTGFSNDPLAVIQEKFAIRIFKIMAKPFSHFRYY